MSRPWENYKPKYGNKRVEYEGEKFDSQKELNRYLELKLLERAGQITDLKRQVPYELIPTQYDENGKAKEKKCVYYADFEYRENGQTIVEDCKGFRTETYKIKRKLMLWRYRVEIRET